AALWRSEGRRRGCAPVAGGGGGERGPVFFLSGEQTAGDPPHPPGGGARPPPHRPPTTPAAKQSGQHVFSRPAPPAFPLPLLQFPLNNVKGLAIYERLQVQGCQGVTTQERLRVTPPLHRHVHRLQLAVDVSKILAPGRDPPGV